MRPSDGKRYQTVFLRKKEDRSAPTAGAAFYTLRFWDAVRDRDAAIAYITLACRLGTFQPPADRSGSRR